MSANRKKEVLFFHTAEFLRQQLAAEAAERSQERLFRGSASELLSRWKCSAVKLNDGTWSVVPSHGYVRATDCCVRLASGGTLRGRRQWRNAAWFSEYVEYAAMGELVLEDGAGANSVFAEDGNNAVRLRLLEPSEAPGDGFWRVEYALGDGVGESMELGDAMAKVGAAQVRFQSAADEERPTLGARVSLLRRTPPCNTDSLLNVLSTLDVRMDAWAVSMSAEALAGVLCGSAEWRELLGPASELLARSGRGHTARKGIVQRLHAAVEAAGGGLHALVAEAQAWLERQPPSARETWPPGVGGGLALRMGALTPHQREAAKAQAARAAAEQAEAAEEAAAAAARQQQAGRQAAFGAAARAGTRATAGREMVAGLLHRGGGRQ